MPRVIGVRFERSGKVFYFDPGDLELGLMDRVVVETDNGPETATVTIAPEQMVYSEVKGPLKPVLRKAEAGESNSDQFAAYNSADSI